MRTALVCVRTPVAAQSIAAYASRLGVTTVRTAVSEAEALALLGERPPELILADTAVAKLDAVVFTRRVLARAPAAVLLLFGTEEPRVAAAAVAAGARGLIRTGDYEAVGSVTKALLLIGSPAVATAGTAEPHLRAVANRAGGSPARTVLMDSGGSMVPAQRTSMAERGALPVSLTERELQVLRGMAEGKSNAEIGRELFLSEQTIKTHARRLFRKLRARDRAHAVAVGFRSGTLS